VGQTAEPLGPVQIWGWRCCPMMKAMCPAHTGLVLPKAELLFTS
jgi:hypothetical protein